MNIFKIMLSNENDFFVLGKNDTWRIDQNIYNATCFLTIEEAKAVIIDLQVNFFYPNFKIVNALGDQV